jgi:hypothetical protein
MAALDGLIAAARAGPAERRYHLPVAAVQHDGPTRQVLQTIGGDIGIHRNMNGDC